MPLQPSTITPLQRSSQEKVCDRVTGTTLLVAGFTPAQVLYTYCITCFPDIGRLRVGVIRLSQVLFRLCNFLVGAAIAGLVHVREGSYGDSQPKVEFQKRLSFRYKDRFTSCPAAHRKTHKNQLVDTTRYPYELIDNCNNTTINPATRIHLDVFFLLSDPLRNHLRPPFFFAIIFGSRSLLLLILR